MRTVFAPLYHFEKKQKTGVFLNPHTGSYLRSAEVKAGTAERRKENKYWQAEPLTLFNTPVKQSWLSALKKKVWKSKSALRRLPRQMGHCTNKRSPGLREATHSPGGKAGVGHGRGAHGRLGALWYTYVSHRQQGPVSLASIRSVVDENRAHSPGQQNLICCYASCPSCCHVSHMQLLGFSDLTPGAMQRGMSSCTYLQPHECKTRERALWVSAAQAREVPEIIPCIAVPPSLLGLRTCCIPLHPAGLGSCRAPGQGSPAGETRSVSVSLLTSIQPWFCDGPVGCRRHSAPGQFWLLPLEELLFFQLRQAKARWWVGRSPGSDLRTFWRR